MPFWIILPQVGGIYTGRVHIAGLIHGKPKRGQLPPERLASHHHLWLVPAKTLTAKANLEVTPWDLQRNSSNLHPPSLRGTCQLKGCPLECASQFGLLEFGGLKLHYVTLFDPETETLEAHLNFFQPSTGIVYEPPITVWQSCWFECNSLIDVSRNQACGGRNSRKHAYKVWPHADDCHSFFISKVHRGWRLLQQHQPCHQVSCYGHLGKTPSGLHEYLASNWHLASSFTKFRFHRLWFQRVAISQPKVFLAPVNRKELIPRFHQYPSILPGMGSRPSLFVHIFQCAIPPWKTVHRHLLWKTIRAVDTIFVAFVSVINSFSKPWFGITRHIYTIHVFP